MIQAGVHRWFWPGWPIHSSRLSFIVQYTWRFMLPWHCQYLIAYYHLWLIVCSYLPSNTRSHFEQNAFLGNEYKIRKVKSDNSFWPKKYAKGDSMHRILPWKIKYVEHRDHRGIYFCSSLLLWLLIKFDLKMFHNTTNSEPRHSSCLLWQPDKTKE